MADSKIIAVLEALLDATKKGEVVWEVGSAENVFRARFAGGGVGIECRIVQELDGRVFQQPVNVFSVWFVNAAHRVIDAHEFEPGQPGHMLLEALFPLARKSGLKVDQVLDNIL